MAAVVSPGITKLVGNTPLLRVRMFERDFPSVEVYAKAEWFNPGGSVKDRAALSMIEDGESRGVLTRDKTIVDALGRAVTTLRERVDAGTPLPEAVADARAAAEEGMRATIPMQARKGRASYLGPRSIGHEDPGAASTALLVTALGRALTT